VYSALKRLKGTVFLHGPYENHELPALLADTDWMVVPSIWYENSPIVIQEAFRSNVPVITSNVGGMAEKVTNMKNGLHFNVGKPLSLCAVLEKVAKDKNLHKQCVAGIIQPPKLSETAKANLALY